MKCLVTAEKSRSFLSGCRSQCSQDISPVEVPPVYTRPCSASHHRRSQDFVWGALFFAKKVDDLFSRRPHNTR